MITQKRHFLGLIHKKTILVIIAIIGVLATAFALQTLAAPRLASSQTETGAFATPEALITAIYSDSAMMRMGWPSPQQVQTYFSPALIELWNKAAPAMRAAPILDGNLFASGAQEVNIATVQQIQKLSGTDITATFSVTATSSEGSRVMTRYRVVKTSKGWRIDDISWATGLGTGNEWLTALLRRETDKFAGCLVAPGVDSKNTMVHPCDQAAITGGKIANAKAGASVQTADNEVFQDYIAPWEPGRKEGSKNFVLGLRNAIATNDIDWIARHTTYPLRVNARISGKHIAVPDEKAFRANYKQIFNPNVIAAINLEDENEVFGNYQGNMIGNGQVWFELDKANRQKTTVQNAMKGPFIFRIYTVNLEAPAVTNEDVSTGTLSKVGDASLKTAASKKTGKAAASPATGLTGGVNKAPVAPKLSSITLKTADFNDLEGASLCANDVPSFIARLKPSAQNGDKSIYVLPKGVTVHGMPAVALLYWSRLTPLGTQSQLVTFVHADQGQLTKLGNSMPYRLGKWADYTSMPVPDFWKPALGMDLPATALAIESGPDAVKFYGDGSISLQAYREWEPSKVAILSNGYGAITCQQYAMRNQLPEIAHPLPIPVLTTAAADLNPDFATGTFLVAPDEPRISGCARIFSDKAASDALDQASSSQNWNEVVRQVTSSRCRNNYTYLLLARAAEAMKLRLTALTYYRIASALSGDDAYDTNCKYSPQKGCRKVEVKKEAVMGNYRLSVGLGTPSDLSLFKVSKGQNDLITLTPKP